MSLFYILIGIIGFNSSAYFNNSKFSDIFVKGAVIFGDNGQYLVPLKKEELQILQKNMVDLAEGVLGCKKTKFDKVHHYRF